MRLLHIVVLLAGLLVSACEPIDQSACAPDNFGLARTSLESELVHRAIDVSNAVLKTTGGDTFSFSGEFSLPRNPRQIPVSVLSSLNLSASDVIWVPPDCLHIYIQAPALRRWINQARHANGYGDPFEEHYVVGFMLLHEMGHVLQHNSGSYLNIDGSSSSLNIQSTNAKRAESAADAFAEATLKRGISSDNGPVAEVASSIVKNLGVLANNFYYATTLSQGLEEILCLNGTLYWDWGYSHPNLVFRLVNTVNRLAPTAQTAEIVQTFENCRAVDTKVFDALR
jgi:hypothetical protein